MKNYQFITKVERDRETGFFIGSSPNLIGAHTQALSLDELNIQLEEVIELCLEEMTEDELQTLPEFVGFQNILVAV